MSTNQIESVGYILESVSVTQYFPKLNNIIFKENDVRQKKKTKAVSKPRSFMTFANFTPQFHNLDGICIQS